MPQLIAVLITAVLLALGGLLTHYEALRTASCLLPALSLPPRQKILVVICIALLGHVLEIGLYACGYWLFLEGNTANLSADALIEQAIYISFESFASLGTSAGFPIGPLRLLAGTEALVGLILIGWTTSYTYIAMRDLWDQH